MLKCQRKVAQIAQAMGAEVDSADPHMLYVDAAPGYTWVSCGNAMICVCGDNGQQTWWVKACEDLIDDMRMGLSKCSEEESKRIEHERGEDWTAPKGSSEHIKFPTA